MNKEFADPLYKYDNRLLENEFLKRHNECLPFIGKNYDDSRLLLVGESHYVEKEDVRYVDRQDYYEISYDDLPEGYYKSYINTRVVFSDRANEHFDKFETFFSNIATEIAVINNQTNDVSLIQKRRAMQQFAFMNYFKRPSYDRGKTIRELLDIDYKIAYGISCYIIDVLKPKLIIFMSKKAYDSFLAADYYGEMRANYKIESVSHPSCAWWNRKRSDGKCAKEDFRNLLSTEIFI